MIHKQFNHPAEQITSFLYSKTARIFTVKLKNNAVIHYQTDQPEVFLEWLKEHASSATMASI